MPQGAAKQVTVGNHSPDPSPSEGRKEAAKVTKVIAKLNSFQTWVAL